MLAICNNTFLKHNAVYWTASLFVSFLNYLYYPVLGRLMDPTHFGEAQTVISVLTQTAVFLQVLGLISVGVIAKYTDESERETISNELSRLTLYLSLVMFGLTVALSPLLKSFFHFTSVGPFFVVALAILLSVPSSFANAYLQGHKKFWTLSVGNVLGAAVKIVASVLLVLLGLQTAGAIGGLVVSQVIGLVYALSKGRGLRHFVEHNLLPHRLRLAVLKPELPYATMVFVTSLTTNLLLSFDILVIKHYFPPEQAGLYTGISIISNIVFYLTGPFAAVLIPSLKPSGLPADNFAVLKRSLALTIGVGGIVTLFFLAFPHFVVGLLLGAKYTPYASYLRGLTLALFAMSVANILIYYHIGLRQFWVAPVVLVGLVTTLSLLGALHSTVGLVVHDLVIGAYVLVGLLVGLTVKQHWRPA